MTVNTALDKNNSNYHHGNLRQTLLSAAADLIADGGIESLSLRKLAEKVGVSRTAAYHYFQDKNDLLCAIAAEGFRRWQRSLNQLNDGGLSEGSKFEKYIVGYMIFATSNPEEYELMFGRSIWKQSKCTQELQTISHATFQHQVDMIEHWQAIGLIKGDNPLRAAQIIWGTLHGIAKLFNDGVYTDVTRIEEIVITALPMFLASTD
ncbi:MAG: TetR/AcrR family transcriptional regulator [Porticoccaceae bacterium]|nr:TetR/AcrR family transcriptional regulator [Porticoccaceae bacterium]